jgi:hypothetical protein
MQKDTSLYQETVECTVISPRGMLGKLGRNFSLLWQFKKNKSFFYNVREK